MTNKSGSRSFGELADRAWKSWHWGRAQRGESMRPSVSESVSGSQSLSGSISVSWRCRHQQCGLQFCIVFDSDRDCDPDADTDCPSGVACALYLDLPSESRVVQSEVGLNR